MRRSKTARSLSTERGSTIIVVALAMTALLSVVALAVDVGMLLTARAEAQRAADAGALAGALALISDPDGETPARQDAAQFAGMNTVQAQPVQVDPMEDVDVDLDAGQVTVRVRRDAARGGPVTTWFARIFGVDLVDVAATATAEYAPAGAATCVKPWAVFDKFDDVNHSNEFDPGIDIYDPATTGYGSDFRNPGQPGDDGQGYINDFGRPIVLKGNWKKGDHCCPGTGPSWYYAWAMPDEDGDTHRGANWYRSNIEACNPAVIEVGQEYDVEPGNMHGPTKQGVNNLIDQDPGASWDTFANEVTGSAWDPWAGSPRVGIVPTFSPAREFDPGRKPIEFTGFIAVFIDHVEGNGNKQKVHGQILYATGIGGGTPGNPAAKFVHLVD